MPRGTGYYVWGVRELRAGLKAAGLSVDDLKDANARVSAFVAARAASAAPRGATGQLRTTVRGTRQAGRAVVRAGRARVPYAGSQEWGWPGSGGRRTRGGRGAPYPGSHYIVDTARRTESQWLPQYQRDLEKIIDKIASGK